MIEQRERPQLPCIRCGTLGDAWRLTSNDYRFPRPFEGLAKGQCEQCKAQVYLQHHASLQVAYRTWLSTNYPTPSFIYGLVDPRYRCICYIGRTANVAKRVWDHRRSASEDSSIKAAWLQHLQESGLTCEYCILAEASPGYYVLELEARWICEGIKRGWPLLNKEANNPYIVRRFAWEMSKVDHWTCSYRDLPIRGDQMAMYRVDAYAQWAQEMPPALPHYYAWDGAEGLASPGWT